MEVQAQINYSTCVEPFIQSFQKVVVPQQTTDKIKAFIQQLIAYKQQNEVQHQIDGEREFKRFYTGLLGEAALEIVLGINIIDWTIGNSKQYNVPDIQSLGIGIKTVEYGKFPIIFKQNTYPQIINLKISDNEILVAGLADVQTLNLYQSDDLILDPNLRSKGTKTGFYGFNKLTSVGNLMSNNTTNNVITVKDEETGANITIQDSAFYSPVIPTQDQAYQEVTSVSMNGQQQTVTFNFPAKPTEDYQLAMWETLDNFEKAAWSPANVGIKTGYDCIDNAFGGGLYPGVVMIAGDSNLGKSALICNLAWNVISKNDDVYVMDFSLDDAMPDKLARMAACSAQIVINSVKTPLKYQNYPLMLIRRKKALIALRNMTDKYRAYDSSFSTFVEDIGDEIVKKLIYFDEHQINKKLVVFIDNFHDMDIRDQPNLSAKDKFDTLAQWCQDFSTKYNITMICSAELKKLNGTRRPQLDDMRESVKIKYAAKAVLLVYNEVHYKGEGANIYYSINNNPYKQPIFEVHFAKNKYGTYKGRNFFEFYPDMAYLKESDPQAQKTYTSIVYG